MAWYDLTNYQLRVLNVVGLLPIVAQVAHELKARPLQLVLATSFAANIYNIAQGPDADNRPVVRMLDVISIVTLFPIMMITEGDFRLYPLSAAILLLDVWRFYNTYYR